MESTGKRGKVLESTGKYWKVLESTGKYRKVLFWPDLHRSVLFWVDMTKNNQTSMGNLFLTVKYRIKTIYARIRGVSGGTYVAGWNPVTVWRM